MKFLILFNLSTLLVSLPATCGAWGVVSGTKPSKSAMFSTTVETSSDATVTTDDGVLVVKAPLKYCGPYPCIGLRFPKLATSAQRALGKSGVSLDFILDTAANTNTIQAPIAKELNIPPAAGGFQTFNLGDTQLDGVMEELFLTDLPASALPASANPNAAGLMSLAFLKLFGGGVEFQWTGRPSVTFYSGKTTASTLGKTRIPIERLTTAWNLPSITLLVNGVEIKALLATGSPITVMNPAAAQLAGVTPKAILNRKAMEAEGDVLSVMDRQGKPVDLIKSKVGVNIQASTVEFGKIPIYVGEIPGMGALGSDGPAIVLGLDVLVQRPSMLLRIEDNEVWFK